MDAPEANKSPSPLSPPKTKPTSQIFEFITLTDSSRIADHDRVTVRKQAMKNNTNRRSKGAKNQSESAQRNRQLTAAPVKQQSEQTKKFRLLPRGLQDLQDTPRAVVSSRRRPFTIQSVSYGTQQTPFDSSSAVDQPSPCSADVSDAEWWQNEVYTAIDHEQYTFDQAVPSPFRSPNEESNRHVTTRPHLPDPLDRMAGNLNPMASLPDGAPIRTRILIHHYFQSQNRVASLMTSVRKSFFALALGDSCFFNVCLSQYANALSFAMGKGDSVESATFRMRSIGLINERLSEVGSMVSDGVIAAVASMVVQEVKNGNSTAVNTHLMGLQQMIGLRGGLVKAQLCAAVQRLIAWAEVNAAGLILSLPPTVRNSSPGLSLPAYKCTATTKAGVVPRTPCPSRDIVWNRVNLDMTSTFAELRYISLILEYKDPKDIDEMDNMWYSDKTYMIQRSLTHMWLSPQLGDSRLDTLCCQVGSLYVDSCLRDLGFHTTIIGILVENLKRDTEALVYTQDLELSESGTGDETLERLMWVFAMGAVAASEWPEHDWFVEQFALACSSLNVVSWKQAESILRGHLWNAQWKTSGPTLWESVLQMRSLDLSQVKVYHE